MKMEGIWKYFVLNERTHLCGVCNHSAYNWRDFDVHKRTHTFAEHDRALWNAVEQTYLWNLSRDCPT